MAYDKNAEAEEQCSEKKTCSFGKWGFTLTLEPVILLMTLSNMMVGGAEQESNLLLSHICEVRLKEEHLWQLKNPMISG